MPHLDRYRGLADSAFFLYPTVEDAKRGTEFGGTGFCLSVPTRWPGSYIIYGVTNWHVAVQGGSSVVRLNRIDNGPPDIFDLGPEDWTFIEHKNDIAITPLPWRRGIHRVHAPSTEMFFDGEKLGATINVGIGDDVFMVGRFTSYVGRETNEPALRFGNISIMDAQIKQPTGYIGRSIVLDMHSRAGYSGSPVFVYRTTGSVFLNAGKDDSTHELPPGHMMAFLGVHWGQFPEEWELKDRLTPQRSAAAQASLITDGKYVEGFSGMTCVIPASAIHELLNLPKILAQRAEIEETWQREYGDPPRPDQIIT